MMTVYVTDIDADFVMPARGVPIIDIKYVEI